MVCETFAIDPVRAIAEGSLLITARPSSSARIIARLRTKKIEGSVIGKVTANRRRRILRRLDGKIERLAVPEQDPFWPAFFEGLERV